LKKLVALSCWLFAFLTDVAQKHVSSAKAGGEEGAYPAGREWQLAQLPAGTHLTIITRQVLS
jgi:hypothetical protein